MRRALLPLLVCAFGLAAQLPAGLDAIPYYDGTLDEAMREAAERNAPVLILCCKEGEEANDRFREQLRDNGSFGEKVSDAIVLLVNDGTHETKEIRRTNADGTREKVTVCKEYHTPSCDFHKKGWSPVYNTLVADRGDGNWPLPSAIILSPDGEVFRFIGHGEPPGESEMIKELQSIRSRFGYSLSKETLQRVKVLTKEGEAMVLAKLWADAWMAYSEVLELAPQGKYADGAREALAAAKEGLDGHLTELEEQVTEGDALEVYSAIATLAFALEGTDFEKRSASIRKKALKRKDLDKDAARSIDLDLEAKGYLRDAKKLVASGDEKGAKRLLKKLKSKKYNESEARTEGLALLEELDQ